MRYLALLLLIPLSGCATLSEEECLGADWETIGRQDGALGRTPDFIEKHARACNQFGVAPIRSEWEKGRQQGLPLYCRPANAWDQGADGHRLSPVCPAEGLAELQRANSRGLTYHRIGQDMAEAERRISDINRELAALAADDPQRAALISDRAALRLDIALLRSERALYRF